MDKVDLYAGMDDFKLVGEVEQCTSDIKLTSQLGCQSNKTVELDKNGYPIIQKYIKVSMYIGNLAWWTTDKQISDAIFDLGVEDLLEIKFSENKINGQSKGYSHVTVASEESFEKILVEFPQIKINGKIPQVTVCNSENYLLFENAAKKDGNTRGKDESDVKILTPNNDMNMGNMNDFLYPSALQNFMNNMQSQMNNGMMNNPIMVQMLMNNMQQQMNQSMLGGQFNPQQLQQQPLIQQQLQSLQQQPELPGSTQQLSNKQLSNLLNGIQTNSQKEVITESPRKRSRYSSRSRESSTSRTFDARSRIDRLRSRRFSSPDSTRPSVRDHRSRDDSHRRRESPSRRESKHRSPEYRVYPGEESTYSSPERGSRHRNRSSGGSSRRYDDDSGDLEFASRYDSKLKSSPLCNREMDDFCSSIEEYEILQNTNKEIVTNAISKALSDSSKGNHHSAIDTLKTSLKIIESSSISNDTTTKMYSSAMHETITSIERKINQDY